MKTKRGVILTLLVIVLLTTLSIAQDEEPGETAYTCLKDKLGSSCGDTQNTEQASFNLLAMAYDSSIKSDCESSIKDKQNDNCWGTSKTSSCNIKSTALAVLALEHVGKNTDDSVDWLLEKRKLASELTWYLEIDANNKTQCEINGKPFTIEDNKKISGTAPSGLTKAYGNYWFEITDINKNFTISCDKNFITALLYQKTGSDVYHISDNTHSAPAGDSVTEKVNAYCFSVSNTCDYEGSLWATLALAKAGKDISSYLPYLSAMTDETSNKKYLPSAFLYMLTNADDYYSELIGLQKQNKFWEESGNKFYDTALALLALQDITTEETTNTKEYLISIQGSSGCWQSDTAFLLYAGWPKTPSVIIGGGSDSDCKDFNHYCVSPSECSLENLLDNFYCPSLSDVCCETEPEQQTCREKSGIICPSNQQCTGREVIAEDTNYCCIDSCQDISTTNECTDIGYLCKSECSSSQEEKALECDYGEVCCAEKQGGSWTIWIIILVVLIILVIIGIIFRRRLRLWLFKSQSKFKFEKTQRPGTRPGFPPLGITPQAPFRRPVPSSVPRRYPAGPPMRRAPPKETPDKDFDETMKKLRDMSK